MNVLAQFEKIKAFFFDVDGVMTDGSVWAMESGDQIRKFNIKDGYAMAQAIKAGYPVVVISAGRSESVRKRLEYLGIKDINIAVADKLELYHSYLEKYQLKSEEVLYMGDDIPDYKVLKVAGLACCPADATNDILPIVHYVSPYNGGQGAVRDVIEKTMKIQGTWPV